MPSKYDVIVLGNWHLAFVTAAVLASQKKNVVLVNPDSQNLKWEQNPPPLPVHEPGLAEMIRIAMEQGYLSFSNTLPVQGASYLWLAVDTPVNERDEVDCAPLLKILDEVFSGKSFSPRALVVSSQVPVGFCTAVEEKYKVPVAYVPENLRLGKGIETFLNADRTVIGSASPSLAKEIQKNLFSGFKTEFLLCNLESAEMIKHATNIFLATSISFANEIARLSEAKGATPSVVAKGLKMDKRIGPAAYVAPGLGFAGGTLPRDIRILQTVGREKEIPTPLLNAVMTVNESTLEVIVESVKERCSQKGSGRALILGYTYKADTDTLRRSLSVDLAKQLKELDWDLIGYDPMMNDKDFSAIQPYIKHVESEDELKNERFDVVLLMTARESFKRFKWELLAKGALVFDTLGFLSAETVLGAHHDYKKIWEPLQSSMAYRAKEAL